MKPVARDGEEWAFLMNYEPHTLTSADYAENERYKLNNAPYFLTGTLKDNKRSNDHLTNKRLVALDFEDLAMSLDEFVDVIHQTFNRVDYLLYPTIHCFNKGDKGFRYRLVLNTDRGYNEEENGAILRALALRLPVDFDEASGTFSQLMGLPILTPHTNAQMIIKNEGKPLPVTALVDSAPPPKNLPADTPSFMYTVTAPGASYAKSLLEEIAQGAREGERNVQLTRLAGRLFYIGLAPEMVYEWLTLINDNFVTPALPDEELNTIFKSILRAEIKRGR